MRYLTIVMLLALLIVSACGGNEQSAPPPTDDSAEVVAETETEPTDTPAPTATPTLSAEDYLKQGEDAYAEDDYDTALEAFNQSLALDPDVASTYNNRGSTYNGLGEYRKAITDFNKALELDDQLAMAYNNRGFAYISLGDNDTALEDFNKALDLDDTLELAYNNRGMVYNNIGDFEQAIADYDKALELDDELAIAYNNRGFALFNMEAFEAAIPDLTKSIEFDPTNELAFRNRGAAHLNLEMYEEAVADFDQAIELDPDITVNYGWRAMAHKELGNVDDAVADLEHYLVVETDPTEQEFAQAILQELTSEWIEYTSEAGNFSVLMPGEPVVQDSDIISMVTVELENSAYMVSYTNLPAETAEFLDAETLLDSTQEGIGSFGEESELVSQQDISFNGFPGRELVYSAIVEEEEGAFNIRLFIIEDRMYQIVAGSTNNTLTKEDVTTFFDSFELLAPPETIEAEVEPADTESEVTEVTEATESSEADEWIEYTSEAGNFLVLMPGEPVVQDSDIMSMIMVELENSVYMVSYTNLPVGTAGFLDAETLLDSTQEGMVSFGEEGELISQQDISFNGFPGRELVYSAIVEEEEAVFNIRLFIIEDRMYQIMAGSTNNTLTEEDITTFFDSFELLAPPETIEAEVEPADTESEVTEVTEATESSEAEAITITVPEETASIGTPVPINNLVLTVNGIQEVEPDSFLGPDEGNFFLGVDVTIENVGSDDEIVASFISMFIVDGDANVYEMDLLGMASLDDEAELDGDIPTGGQSQGIVTFQVPLNAEQLVFVFDENPFGEMNAIYIALDQ